MQVSLHQPLLPPTAFIFSGLPSVLIRTAPATTCWAKKTTPFGKLLSASRSPWYLSSSSVAPPSLQMKTISPVTWEVTWWRKAKTLKTRLNPKIPTNSPRVTFSLFPQPPFSSSSFWCLPRCTTPCSVPTGASLTSTRLTTPLMAPEATSPSGSSL